MALPRNNDGGYIGLLALLIVVVIIVFLMMRQFQTYWTGQLNTSTSTPPIIQAENAKNILESHYRNILNQ